MSLALFIYLLFISFMKSANGMQFLIIIFYLLFWADAASVFGVSIVPLTSIYAFL